MEIQKKFEQIVNQIDDLIERGVTNSSLEFQFWKTETERAIIKKYGEGSFEHQKFSEIEFGPDLLTEWTQECDFKEYCQKGLLFSKMLLKTYLDESQEGENMSLISSKTTSDFSKVFIVHGHNECLKQSVARLIEQQGLTAIILHEQANKGATIIEKIEANSDVNAAICLFTSDDIGRSNREGSTDSPRARQNVVFETGYFIGTLGRKNVIIIADKEIEFPSDLNGVVYTNSACWEDDVLKELKGLGYKIDLNRRLGI